MNVILSLMSNFSSPNELHNDDVDSAHLGGCSDRSISGQVETPLPKPHHGLITPVFGLCDVLVYLL